jgi:hypothetical protein
MSSNDRPEGFDLERDLPTTADDVVALARLRRLTFVRLEDYLRFLAAFEPPEFSALRASRGPAGAPFDLLS